METPVQIDFRNCDEVDRYRERIETLVGDLEDQYGRLIACRVSVCGPSGHHRTGAPLEVGIHLELPGGRRIDAARTPYVDERHSDPWFAINDAFKRAGRQLRDTVEKLQWQTSKRHENGMSQGVVRMIDRAGDYGFLETADGREVYFHRNALKQGSFERLRKGTRVTFSAEDGDKGPQAIVVRTLGRTRKG